MHNSRVFPMPFQEIPEWAGSQWSQTNQFLSHDECNAIIDWAENSGDLDWAGTVGYDEEKKEAFAKDDDSRIVLSRGIPDSDFSWLYERLSNEVQLINDLFWNFDIRGMHEDISFLKYQVFEDRGAGKFDWHTDVSGAAIRNRKITCIIQLSDPEDYEGCDLQFFTNGELTCNVVEKGSMLTFPSFKTHRITPITKGTRYSLVLWVTGPPFR